MSVAEQLKDDPEAASLQAEARRERNRRKARKLVDDETRGPVPKVIGFGLEQLLRHDFPRRRAIIHRGDVAVLRAGNLGEVYANRGVGKTWFTQTLALVAAYPVAALGFHAPEPSNVLYVDGEMASEEIRDRFALLARGLKVPDLGLLDVEPRLVIVGADWQDGYLPRLDTAEGQQAIEPFVARADLVFLDNRSALFDPEGEKDATAWQPAQDLLLSLRRRGKATVLVHHTNRQGGARGHSKAEDPMDLLVKLTRPDDYTADQGARFTVEFEKNRGFYGPAAAPFSAELHDGRWTTSAGEASGPERKLIDYLRAALAAEDSPKSATAAVRGAGVGKAAGLEIVGRLMKEGRIVKTATGLVLAGSGAL